MNPLRPTVHIEHINDGSYQEIWNYQTSLHRQLVDKKLSQRDLSHTERTPQQHRLLLCEHQHVYTLGKSGHMDHLLLSQTELGNKNIEFFKINRGGDITYHGPGQLVVYPILDMDEFFTDVHRYVRLLEEVVIQTIGDFGLKGIRIEEYTGVWLPPSPNVPFGKQNRKICAIGVHLSRWVSLHGLALNVNTDLTMFEHIVPCGIDDRDMTVTSMEQELGRTLSLADVKSAFCHHFATIFDCRLS